jgi:hypothetical protein
MVIKVRTGLTRGVLTTQNCPALVPVDNVKSGCPRGR